MMMVALSELELHCIDELTRPQLIGAIRERFDCLPEDLRLRLEEQGAERLRLLLLAALLIQVLRQAPCCRGAGESPEGRDEQAAPAGQADSFTTRSPPVTAPAATKAAGRGRHCRRSG
jgi:hypothetical protein